MLGKSAAMGFLHEVALGCGECGGPTDDGRGGGRARDSSEGFRKRADLQARTRRRCSHGEAGSHRWARLRALVKHDMRAAKWTLKLKTTDFRISTRDTADKENGQGQIRAFGEIHRQTVEASAPRGNW